MFSDAPVVTIASFAPTLVVITSKQRPRKLTIHGSDGEDYAFLLKGHEDLRQDERVMQVKVTAKGLALFISISTLPSMHFLVLYVGTSALGEPHRDTLLNCYVGCMSICCFAHQ